MIDQKDVTIVIPHLGANEEQRQSLNKCYLSISSSMLGSKIIVAQNGWNKNDIPVGTIAMVDQGQCKAVNAAASTVETKWMLVTNDDMVYAPGWFEKLTEGMEDKLCVSPVLVEPISGAPPFIKKLYGRHDSFEMDKWLEFARGHEDKTWETGFNLPFLIRMDLWEVIGGYDINYDPWGSNGDSDLQAKIHLAGTGTWRNRNSTVYHFSQTSGTFKPENRPHWSKNWNYFIQKWGFERQGDSHKVWGSQDLIDYDRLIFNPHWKGIYAKVS